MSVISSARSFLRRVRHDGVSCIPEMVYTRWMTFIHRDILTAEKTRREAENEAYQAWIRQHTQPEASPFHTAMRLSFLIPTYNTRSDLLRALADSLLAQSYPNWEACFYDGASTRADTRAALQALPAQDGRFRVQLGSVNHGIAGNTNAALAMAQGEIVALCDHDDLLAPDAVRCILEAAENGADLIYTDEDKVSEDGTRFFDPHLKADFAPDTLRAGNYVCHLTAMTRGLMQRIGGLRPAYDGSQDHDLVLRASEQAAKIVHIPRILYHWRMLDASFSHQRAAKCVQAACDAVADQLRRLSIPAEVRMEALRVRIRYAVPERSVTAIVVGEGSVPKVEGEIIRIGSFAEAKTAAERATGKYLVFLAGGMNPLDGDWLTEMLMYAQRPDVGCVGSAILDRQRFYRHAGYAVDVPGGAVSHHAGQWLYGHPYMITDRLVRNVTGVSSSLLLIRRDTFLALGGFGEYESDLRGADLGLKCLDMGLVNVYTPHARMAMRIRNSEFGIRNCVSGAEVSEGDLLRFRERWGEHPCERYYSPLFTRDGTMTVDMGRKEAGR